jgi:excinuclease ABC subunit A
MRSLQMSHDHIDVKGARVHNLKDVSLRIPKRSLVVFTGPSGSGKSSMAFDTLFAEGQRRYIESLSVYARQFVGHLAKPDVDEIRGLSPTVSIEQKSISHNPRSTVGTITEVHDHLRLLYARLGQQHCYRCGGAVGAGSAETMITSLQHEEPGTKFQVLAPLVQNRKGEFRELFEGLRTRGFTRVRIDGEWRPLDEVDIVRKSVRHTIDVLTDRIVAAASPDVHARIRAAIESAIRESSGDAIILYDSGAAAGTERLVSTRNMCVPCGIAYPPLTQQSFSFNSPLGRCPTCLGIGTFRVIDPDRVVPDGSLSIREGAIAPARSAESAFAERLAAGINKAVKALGISAREPFDDLPPEHQHTVLFGERPAPGTKKSAHKGLWEGVIPLLQRALDSVDEAEDEPALLSSYIRTESCTDCKGGRLRPESRSVLFQGNSLPQLSEIPISDLRAFFDTVTLAGREALIGNELVAEIQARLGFLADVGVHYLSLGRPGPTLSGGEAQRIRLAGQLGSRLTGVLYVLDEPSIGLHQRDNHQLLQSLVRLRDSGNSVLVVEHDRDTMLAADWLVDFGPAAGAHGGQVQFTGHPSDVLNQQGVTADYLTGRRSIEIPALRRTGSGRSIHIHGARANNLRNLDVSIPLGTFTVVTGVSGAGKSTLVHDILFNAAANLLYRERRPVGLHTRLDGLEHIDKVIEIDQQPIGRTPRSNPATYTKLFDEIRSVFSNLPDAHIYGYAPGRFSFNVKGGRCEECSGVGRKRIEMNFMADAWVECEVCRGRRFNEATLRVRYRGHSIADVLDMSCSAAAELFEAYPRLSRRLRTLVDVGLGYIKLGQPSTTLSGGEAQRIKLSRELSKVATGGTLYVLDEPSTGLHFEDIRKLLLVIGQLVDAGNTVVMIEHNMDIIKVADHVIDLGPEGGHEGGRIVASGTPEQVAAVVTSHTGYYLRQELPAAPAPTATGPASTVSEPDVKATRKAGRPRAPK